MKRTEFQQRIFDYIKSNYDRDGLNFICGVWDIAQEVFPETWSNRASRGVLAAHIRRVCNNDPEILCGYTNQFSIHSDNSPESYPYFTLKEIS